MKEELNAVDKDRDAKHCNAGVEERGEIDNAYKVSLNA